MFKKILLMTFFIYYGYEAYAHMMSSPEDCLGWVCEEVQCPDGYAIWIPEEGKFLPCDKWDQYTKIGNKSVLK